MLSVLKGPRLSPRSSCFLVCECTRLLEFQLWLPPVLFRGALWKDLLASFFVLFIPEVIQFVTFSSPIVGGHLNPLKGSLNHPKKVTKNCQVGFQVSLLLNCKNGGFPMIKSQRYEIANEFSTAALTLGFKKNIGIIPET